MDTMTSRDLGLFFVILTASFLLLVPAALAQNEPLMPHLFYGQAYIGGTPAPAGTPVEAWCPGIVNGTAGNPLITGEGGTFGGPGSFDEKLIVSGTMPAGTPIIFYVGGTRALCREIGSTSAFSESIPFEPSQYTGIELQAGTGSGAVPATSGTTPVTPTATTGSSAGSTGSGGAGTGEESAPVSSQTAVMTTPTPGTAVVTGTPAGSSEVYQPSMEPVTPLTRAESGVGPADTIQGTPAEKPRQAGPEPVLQGVVCILGAFSVALLTKRTRP